VTTAEINGAVRHLPLAELLRRFRAEAAELAGVEMDVLRDELGEKRRRAVSAVALGGIALLLALCGLGALVAAAILGLDTVLPAWAAALIVGAVLVIGAIGAALAARAQLHRVGTPIPRRTIDNVKEDVTWLTTRARSGLS